ncbi:MAG: PH domain-containing protein [Planctomycetota bacterium]|jgi:hypothetical protein
MMRDRAIRWYPSKVDSWVFLLLLLLPIVEFAVMAVSLITRAWSAAAIGLLALLFVGCLYAGCVLPMRYGLDDEFLVVRFGICRTRVRIADIREVYRTNNPLSSPALSLDRLWIQHGPRWYQAVMISPRDQEGFIADLAARVPLEPSGRGWKKTGSS